MGFYWSLSDSKSPQVSRTLLSILAVLKNTVVWMVVTSPPTSKSSSSFNNLLYFFVVEIIEENTNLDSMMFYFGARKLGFYVKL